VTDNPAPAPTLAAAAVDRLIDPQRAGYLDDAARLITACRELIAETGSVDPPVAAILRRAGLGSRAFYRLFPGKRDLLMAVLEHATESLLAWLRERLEPVADPRERITAWIEAFVARATSHPADGTASLIIDAPRFGAQFPETAERLELRIVAPVEQALGEIRPGEDAGRRRADALVVYDVVASAVVRSLSRGKPIDAHTLAHLHDCASTIIDRP
jgi:AcrR family transcriptional regulator